MAVSLVPKFNRNDIVKVLNEKRRQIEEAILLRLQRIGEQFVTNARNDASFTDRTGNLRSSIGYVIIKDGQQLFENFKTKKGGDQGETEARQVIEDAKKDFPRGLVLIGVAGMDYAAAVESKGYDVISNSAGTAATSLKLAMVQLGKKLK